MRSLFTIFYSCCFIFLTLLTHGCSDDFNSMGGKSPLSDADRATSNWEEKYTLHFSYPYPGQDEVPANTPIFLRFSHALSSQHLQQIEDEPLLFNITKNQSEPTSITVLEGGRGISILPKAGMIPACKYRIDTQWFLNDKGESIDTRALGEYEFTTAGLHSGPKDLIGRDEFKVMRATPFDEFGKLGKVPLMDNATFRFSFNYPLDTVSFKLGDTVNIEARSKNGVWETIGDVQMLIQGRYLTLDPAGTLATHTEHRITFRNVKSIYGNVISEWSRSELFFENSSPREVAVAKVGNLDASTRDDSPFTNNLINSIVIDTHVIGKNNLAVLSGDLPIELGFVPNIITESNQVVPLSAKAGNVMRADQLPVSILGLIDSGIKTGKITLTLLSDASGYLFPNPYSTSPDAPKLVVLTMDAAMTAEGDVANGALSQTLLSVDLVGSGMVESGVLKLDAVGFAQPNVLGLETGRGLLSLHAETYPDQRNVQAPAMDSELPFVQTFTHGEAQWGSIRPGDTMIVNFSKPISPKSILIPGAVSLRSESENLTELGKAPMRVDGASLVIDGSNIEHNSSYWLELSTDITDLQGNPLDHHYSLDAVPNPMHLPEGNPENLRSPIITNIYPGMSCALVDQNVEANMEQSEWNNGRCVGGKANDPLYEIPDIAVVERIRIVFSRSIDQGTFNEKTFFVERRLKSGGAWEKVSGTLKTWPQRLEFYPDSPWEEAYVYRHTIKSNGNNRSSVALCGVDSVCTADNAPLQTQLIAPNSGSASKPRGGGNDIINYFVLKNEDRIYVTLRLLPTVDVNANLKLDRNGTEPDSPPIENAAKWVDGELVVPTNHLTLELTDTSGVISSANIGCKLGSDCPENRFAYIAQGGLNAVVPEYDPEVYVERTLIDGDPHTHEDTVGAIKGFIPPTVLTTTGAFLQARALNLITIGLDTGPLVLRTQQVVNGKLDSIRGYITSTADGPWFSAQADFILDAPELRPALGPIVITHDLRSKLIAGVKLEGPLRFASDGRLDLKLVNPEPINIVANLSLFGIGLASAQLTVPPLGAKINFVFLPTKDF